MIIGSGYDASALARLRVGANDHRKIAQHRIDVFFHGGIKRIHIHVNDNSHVRENSSTFRGGLRLRTSGCPMP